MAQTKSFLNKMKSITSRQKDTIVSSARILIIDDSRQDFDLDPYEITEVSGRHSKTTGTRQESPVSVQEAEDAYFQQIRREATAACFKCILDHLEEFIMEYLDATYEQWIANLHPENMNADQVDHRFYVECSDHLQIWNLYMTKEGRSHFKVEPSCSRQVEVVQ